MTSPVFKKTRTAVVDKAPAVIIPPAPTPVDRPAPIASAVLVESPPQASLTQLDRIEALLKKACARLQC